MLFLIFSLESMPWMQNIENLTLYCAGRSQWLPLSKGWRRPSTKACQYILKATGLNDLTILKAILPLRAKGWKTPWCGENLQVVQSWRQPRRYQPLLRLMQLIEWRPQYACYSKRLGQCHTKVLYYKVDLQPPRSYRNSNEGQLSNLEKSKTIRRPWVELHILVVDTRLVWLGFSGWNRY